MNFSQNFWKSNLIKTIFEYSKTTKGTRSVVGKGMADSFKVRTSENEVRTLKTKTGISKSFLYISPKKLAKTIDTSLKWF